MTLDITEENIFKTMPVWLMYNFIRPSVIMQGMLPVITGTRRATQHTVMESSPMWALAEQRMAQVVDALGMGQGLVHTYVRRISTETAGPQFGVHGRVLEYSHVGRPLGPKKEQDFYLFRGDDADVAEQLSALDAAQQEFKSHKFGDPEFKELEHKIALMIANLTEIPECCAQAYADQQRDGGIPKHRAADQLYETIGRDKQLYYFAGLDQDLLFSYWGWQVYPCEPGCAAAAAIGRKILDEFGQKGMHCLAQAYLLNVLPHNAFQVYCTPYMKYSAPAQDGAQPISLTPVEIAKHDRETQASMNKILLDMWKPTLFEHMSHIERADDLLQKLI